MPYRRERDKRAACWLLLRACVRACVRACRFSVCAGRPGYHRAVQRRGLINETAEEETVSRAGRTRRPRQRRGVSGNLGGKAGEEAEGQLAETRAKRPFSPGDASPSSPWNARPGIHWLPPATPHCPSSPACSPDAHTPSTSNAGTRIRTFPPSSTRTYAPAPVPARPSPNPCHSP